MTISEQIESIKERVCDCICKYTVMPIPEGKNDDWLFDDDSPCKDCPLNDL